MLSLTACAVLCYAGVEFLWRVYLQHHLNKVATLARDTLLRLYTDQHAGLTMQNFVW